MARAYGIKTNEGARPSTHAPGERPGTRATMKYVRTSAYKVREVLDEIRGRDVREADDILRYSPRDAAIDVRKCLRSAVANAENNVGLDGESLFVSACVADEGRTIKRWRPRARGRATRIRKRTTHITVIVSPLAAEELARRQERDAARMAAGGPARRSASATRAARVARSRAQQEEDAPVTDEVVDDEAIESEDVATDEAVEPEAVETADDAVEAEGPAIEVEIDTEEPTAIEVEVTDEAPADDAAGEEE